jgi:hypothetical protein
MFDVLKWHPKSPHQQDALQDQNRLIVVKPVAIRANARGLQ